MGYETTIIRTLSRLGKNGTENPDAKHNAGRLLGDAFLWDAVARYAEARREAAWTAVEKAELIPSKKSLTPGKHHLADSPSFAVTADVTQPVRKFDGEELATLFAKSKYKVPVSTTKELVEEAKVPTTSRVTLKVLERG